MKSTLAIAALAALAVTSAMPHETMTDMSEVIVDRSAELVGTEFVDYEDLLESLEEHGEESMEFFYEQTMEAQDEESLEAGIVRGVDYSTALSTSVHTCFKKNGNSFVIPRGYRSYGAVDPNLATNVKNARAAGISLVDTYFFPHVSGNAASQIAQLKNYIKSHNLKLGMIWFDVEGTQYWNKGHTGNRNFFNSWMSAAKKAGWKIGIYSSKYQWESIFGTGFNVASSYPLWYAHYDRKATFSDFSSFGGWKRPTMKQYIGDVYLCGAGVDHNFR